VRRRMSHTKSKLDESVVVVSRDALYQYTAGLIWVPLRVVSGVGRWTGVLDGSTSPKERERFQGFSPHWFE